MLYKSAFKVNNMDVAPQIPSSAFFKKIRTYLFYFLQGTRVPVPNNPDQTMLGCGGSGDFTALAFDLMKYPKIVASWPFPKSLNLLPKANGEFWTSFFRTTTALHQNGENFKQGCDTEILDFFPAQELIVDWKTIEPHDWTSVWQRLGGRITTGQRMIAKKDDSIWLMLSKFGVPWPPYDYGSGMGVRDIERLEAEALGVLPLDSKVKKPSTTAYRMESVNITKLPVHYLQKLAFDMLII
jgi:hypothetical protein